MMKFFIWFGCGLFAGFLCGLWRFATYLYNEEKDLFDELHSRITEEKDE